MLKALGMATPLREESTQRTPHGGSWEGASAGLRHRLSFRSDFVEETMRVAFQALAVVCLIAVSGCGSSGTGDAAPLTRLRCGVGPYFPTPGETRKQFDPLFEEMAKQLGVPAEIVVTEDWIGLAEALRARTLDVCWMGPWGYVLARHHDPSMTAIGPSIMASSWRAPMRRFRHWKRRLPRAPRAQN
jgi:hypothetical protein